MNILETIGHDIVDKCDSLLAAAKMPLSPAIHVEGLVGGLKEIRQTARLVFVEMAGEEDPSGNENGSSAHAVEEDFAHFMTYSGFSVTETDETIAKLRKAFEAAW